MTSKTTSHSVNSASLLDRRAFFFAFLFFFFFFVRCMNLCSLSHFAQQGKRPHHIQGTDTCRDGRKKGIVLLDMHLYVANRKKRLSLFFWHSCWRGWYPTSCPLPGQRLKNVFFSSSTNTLVGLDEAERPHLNITEEFPSLFISFFVPLFPWFFSSKPGPTWRLLPPGQGGPGVEEIEGGKRRGVE